MPPGFGSTGSDLSAFMKELKLKFTLAYNYSHGRSGALWDGRFKNLLVQGGETLRAVAAYIDLNCRKRLAEWLCISARSA